LGKIFDEVMKLGGFGVLAFLYIAFRAVFKGVNEFNPFPKYWDFFFT